MSPLADRKGSQPVAIVNETFAREVFGNADPIGHTIKSGFTNEQSKLIVGVVREANTLLSARSRGLVYISHTVPIASQLIGLRVALGASSLDVLRLIGQHSLVLVISGIIVGLALAYFAMQPLTLFLVPGLSTVDSTAILAGIGVLGAVALLATLIPAIRALRVDPMVALRYE